MNIIYVHIQSWNKNYDGLKMGFSNTPAYGPAIPQNVASCIAISRRPESITYVPKIAYYTYAKLLVRYSIFNYATNNVQYSTKFTFL